MNHIYKIITAVAIALSIPAITFASIAAPWYATSTNIGTIQPSRINGNDPIVQAKSFIATSPSATNQFNGNLNVGTALPLQQSGIDPSNLAIGQFSTSTNDVESVGIYNTNAGTNAASFLFFGNNLTSTSTNGIGSSYYAGIGIAGSNLDYSPYGITAFKSNDAVWYNSDGDVVIAAASSTGAIRMYTGKGLDQDYPRLTVSANGNVGVDESNPQYSLDVAGAIGNSGSGQVNIVAPGSQVTLGDGDQSANGTTLTVDDANKYSYFFNSLGGNTKLGVNTNTPHATLDVNGTLNVSTTTATSTFAYAVQSHAMSAKTVYLTDGAGHTGNISAPAPAGYSGGFSMNSTSGNTNGGFIGFSDDNGGEMYGSLDSSGCAGFNILKNFGGYARFGFNAGCGGVQMIGDGSGLLTFNNVSSVDISGGSYDGFNMDNSNGLWILGDVQGTGNNTSFTVDDQNQREVVTQPLGVMNGTPVYSLDVSGDANVTGCYRVNGVCQTSSVVTTSISGAIVGLGCDSANTASPVTLASTTAFVTTPESYPGDGLTWQSYALNSTTIRTKVCSDVTVTPAASLYVVKIIK